MLSHIIRLFYRVESYYTFILMGLTRQYPLIYRVCHKNDMNMANMTQLLGLVNAMNIEMEAL